MLKRRFAMKAFVSMTLAVTSAGAIAQEGRPPHEGRREEGRREEAKERDRAKMQEALRKDGPEFMTGGPRLQSANALARDSGQLSPSVTPRNNSSSGGDGLQKTVPLPGARKK